MNSLAFTLSPSFASSHLRLPPRRTRCSCSLSAPVTRGNAKKNGSIILWFKQDLRIDDHPGLVAASDYQAVVPLYVFDRRILSRYSDEMLELLLFALRDLRKSLQEQGSNLMIRFGRAESVIQELLKEVEATHIFSEEEVDYHLCEVIYLVEHMLATIPTPERSPRKIFWQTPFYDIKNVKDMTESYEEFVKLQLPITSCLQPPVLPGASTDLDWGSLPTFDDLKEFMVQNKCHSRESWALIKETSAQSALRRKLSKFEGTYQNNSNLMKTKGSPLGGSVFVTQNPYVVGPGTNAVLNALAAYLRYLEGTARYDWQEVHDRLRTVETRDGASFAALFGRALHLGTVSRRRVYYEAIKYERERNAGFLSPFGYSAATVAAAVDAVCSMEWYWLLAQKSQIDHGAYSIRIWRWNGHLIQYTSVGHEGPAILLVHGFGAFLEHYRDNINSISEGYFVSIVACLWPVLAKSLVLINSAGNIIPQYTSLQFSEERRTSGMVWLGARILLFYLRLNIKSIVKNCYPTKAERADDWLTNAMLRASHDPGVLVVLESIFSFNLSLPLNFLLKEFEERVLIIQGTKDPISDSKSELALIKEHCPGIIIKELDAGHCPHDEQPEQVNLIICEWVMSAESKILAER
ncbi:uncharacterized protein LOC119985219 isoform X2 [Tripterygium wilfordii]|uniref:uncharacterized protein LOC119985219 isoform X2 n=1 Tax=Tripterygium wilfordii TaxID=458696 RepID=UPI0018F82414|nr:uncharacterized protein LOC119985219 isoform X2 [Tripterygium wilfordii]